MNTYPLQDSGKVCNQLRTSIWLTEMMVSILQQYFGSPERVALENSRFTWNDSNAESGLYINNVDNLDYKNMGSRPACLVDLEDKDLPPEVIGDLHSYYAHQGQSNFYMREKSAWVIECWAGTKLEAMSLGDEVRYFINTYRHPIAVKYRFDQIRVLRQLKPVKYKEFDHHWIARVLVGYEMQDNWGCATESLKVTGFNLKLESGQN